MYAEYIGEKKIDTVGSGHDPGCAPTDPASPTGATPASPGLSPPPVPLPMPPPPAPADPASPLLGGAPFESLLEQATIVAATPTAPNPSANAILFLFANAIDIVFTI